jgi:hypothetical protein
VSASASRRCGGGSQWRRAFARSHAVSAAAVGDVYLDEVDWAKARVGIKDALEDALQGAAELHGVARSEA